MSEERLQKVLARAGIAARRKAEELITAGRVRVDGQVVTTLGTKVDPKKQRIELDGRPVLPEQLCYGIFHKPRGMVTTLHDPEGRPTAMDVLREVGVRVVPVGRLDFNTSGALLFTNDGQFAQVLTHASGNVPKVYSAKVQQRVEESDLTRWAESIEIEGKMTRPAQVRILRREDDKSWLEVTLKEGKNHQVRRLGEHAGTPVVRLARLSHAGIETLGLRPGQWRLLTTDELKALRAQYGVPDKIRGALSPGASPNRASNSSRGKAPGRSGSGRGGPSGPKTSGARGRGVGQDNAERSERSLASEGRRRAGRTPSEGTAGSGARSRRVESDSAAGARGNSRVARERPRHGESDPRGGRADARGPQAASKGGPRREWQSTGGGSTTSRSAGGKPTGGKPAGGKPAGGKPAGGKPGRSPAGGFSRRGRG